MPDGLIPELASTPGRNYAAALPDRYAQATCAPRPGHDNLDGQINDEITLMDAGELKWIGQELPLDAMVAVDLMLQELAEEKVIKVRRKNHEKTTGLKQVDRILVEKL